MPEMEQTIAALSTPPGESGIAVVRISGKEALRILSSAFQRPDQSTIAPKEFEHRRLYHGFLRDPAGERIDEVVCAVMRGPESYTGEDVVEVSCHGSLAVVEKMLDCLYKLGAREAEPGEFTKRAFLNGKMDLIQAEAVCDLIHARTELQRKVASDQLAGFLSTKISKLAEDMLSLLGDVEANIDFLEEDIDILDREKILSRVRSHIGALDKLLDGAGFCRPFREGFQVVLTGPTNAGKSSVFNRLLGERRAIVTDIPGTTRDVLREPSIIGGLLFLFQDTAGFRKEIRDDIEAMGIDMAAEARGRADIILTVLDSSEELPAEIRSERKTPRETGNIVVLNKIDLSPRRLSEGDVLTLFPGAPVAEVSAKTGEGFEELSQELVRCAGGEGINRLAMERAMLNYRLARLLGEAREASKKVEGSLSGDKPLELLALDMREVLSKYEEATGRKYTEKLLENIFSRFCIGK